MTKMIILSQWISRCEAKGALGALKLFFFLKFLGKYDVHFYFNLAAILEKFYFQFPLLQQIE